MLSIIITVYNIDAYISKCINSIFNQGIEDFEILLINDGSTDKSGEICDKWTKKDGRIRVIHKENGGVNTARNFGLNEVQGDWITFVDGDDYIEQNTFKKCFEFLEENPEIDILQFPEIHDKEGLKIFWDGYPKNFTLIKGTKDKALALIGDKPRLPGGIWGKIYRKKVWEGIRVREDMQFCEDMYTLPDLLEKCNLLAISPKGGYCYVQRKGSASKSTYTPKKCLDVSRLKFKLFQYAFKNNIDKGRWWNEAAQASIDAWHSYGEGFELKNNFKNLAKLKKKCNPDKQNKIMLKIAQFINPLLAAKINSFIINIRNK